MASADERQMLRGGKVELLLGGAFGAAREVEGGGGIFGLHDELLDGTEELRGLIGQTSRQEETKDARVVVAKVDLLAIGQFDVEKMAEVRAEVLEREVAGNEDAPALGPGLLGEGFDEGGFLGNANQVRREMG